MKHNLKKIRLENDLKQIGLANEVGISKSYYSNIENGTKVPSLEIAFKIAKALGVAIEDIFDINQAV